MNDQRNSGSIGQQAGQIYGDSSAKGAIAGAIRGASSLEAACEARQTAKGVIRDRIFRLREEADRLETLLRALPEELPPKADRALWDLAIAARRG